MYALSSKIIYQSILFKQREVYIYLRLLMRANDFCFSMRSVIHQNLIL